jgi:beta-lactamase superfamily II metal-dependent hydrolase
MEAEAMVDKKAKPAKKKKKPNANKTNSTQGRNATIRMYNVGFGDAFLVSLPSEDRLRRILFDCGSIEAAEGMKMSNIVARIIEDVADPDGVPRIDVVVATHRHKDHVSGFGDPLWDTVEVKEVWMPWTEDPNDAEARRIRDTQSRLALSLDAALTAMAAAPDDGREGLNRYRDIVANALMLSNDRAMKTLHSGFIGNPKRRFLPAKSAVKRTLETDVLPGIKVHVLGPSRSRDVIRDMEPPKGKSFLRLHGALNGQNGMLPAPFPVEFRADHYTGGGSPQTDEEEIQYAGSLTDLAVAVALDKAVNGTSLMLMLELSGTFLLFPGDAQWGTWKAAMEDPEWKEMLGKVSFYKIGHHGSHNATPRDFVEKMIPDGICAMASTLTRQIWPEIPKGELLAGLVAKKASIARSDQAESVDEPFELDHGVIEAHIAF